MNGPVGQGGMVPSPASRAIGSSEFAPDADGFPVEFGGGSGPNGLVGG